MQTQFALPESDTVLAPEPKLRLTCIELAIECFGANQSREDVIKSATMFYHYILGTLEVK